jgi:hypothetical protein
MAYLIVVGGISVNDPEDHDLYPYNFLNPAVAKAKALKASVAAKDIILAFFAPPYEERVKKQRTEHKIVDPTYLPTTSRGQPKQKDPAHFANVARKSAASAGATYAELRKDADLTSLLNNKSPIKALYYFGHSDDVDMFLEYSVSIASGGTVIWGPSQARGVPKAKFAAGAKFISYGCNQGDPHGLCQQLSKEWGIRCVGSKGKTDFEPIGQNKPFPASASGWVAYTNDVLDPNPVDITKEL